MILLPTLIKYATSIATLIANASNSQYSFRAISTAAQNTGNNTFAHTSYATEQYDVGGNYDAGTSIYTVPVTGLYNVYARIGTSATSTRFLLSVFVDGAEITRGADIANANSAAQTSSQVSTTLYLEAGQEVEIKSFGNTAKALLTTAYAMFFGIDYIGSV